MGAYQGSVKSGVTVTLYPNNGDGTFGDAIRMDGHSAQSLDPCVINCHVQRSLGSGASFAVTFKKAKFLNPLDNIPVESWVDISFTQNGLSWHVLRGLVDEVREMAGLGGSGATTLTYTMIGRGFQKIYDDTPAMFNAYLGDLDNSDEVLRALNSFRGSPDVVCRTILVTLLSALGQKGRGLWRMPPHMPNTQPLFVGTARFDTSRFDLYGISRSIVSPSLFLGGGPLWGLAQQYSDPMFTELFTELLPSAQSLQSPNGVDTTGKVGLSESASQMVAVLRDKPFMAADPLIGEGPLLGDSPYFDLPKFTISRQLVTSINAGKSAYERYNAFVLSPPPSSGQADNFITYKLPLWDTTDQLAHGFRQMTISQSYELFDDGNGRSRRTVDDCTRALKRLVRDHYCVNANFLSGTVSMGRGAPWLKVGCRVEIVDGQASVPTLNGYLESYSHEWNLAGGSRTAFSFTRGFYGSEGDMLTTLINTSGRYTEPYVKLGLAK